MSVKHQAQTHAMEGVGLQSQRGLRCVFSLGLLLLLGSLSLSRAAERQPQQHGSGATNTVQEQLLQRFISHSLTPDLSRPIGEEGDRNSPATASPQPVSEPSSVVLPGGQSRELTVAATKIVLALGVILIFLIVGAYVLRHFVLHKTSLGKPGHLLRVVAKVPLSPKVAVALIEVPGKAIVVSITGTSVLALGEVTEEALARYEDTTKETPSFAAALEQHTPALEAQEQPEDALLQVPEAIQRKVRGLKRL